MGSGTNNPENGSTASDTTPAAAPSTTPAATDTAPPQDTAAASNSEDGFDVAGKTYHAQELSDQDADAIYDALPPEYKKLAESYAWLAKNYESLIKIDDLPPGVTTAQALKELIGLGNASAEQIQQAMADKPYLKELQDQLSAALVPENIRKAASAGNNANDFVDGATTALGDMAAAPGRIFHAGHEALGEATAAALPGISDAQAKAFGVAAAGLLYQQNIARQNMPVFSFKQSSMLFTYPVETLHAGIDALALKFPFVEMIWSALAGFGTFIGDWLTHLGDKTKPEANLGESIAKVKSALEEKRTGDTSWNGLAHAAVRGNANDMGAVRSKLEKIGNIDGVDTKDLAGLTAKGGLYVAQDGTVHETNTAADGQLIDTQQKDDKGNPITRSARVTDSVAAIGGETAQKLQHGTNWQKAGIFLGAAVGSDTAYGVAQGLTRQAYGDKNLPAKRAKGYMTKADKKLADAKKLREGKPLPWETEAGRIAKAEKLEAAAAKLQAQAATHADIAAGRAAEGNAFIEAANAPRKEWWRVGNNFGRWIGDTAGGIGERSINLVASLELHNPFTKQSITLRELVSKTHQAAKDAVAKITTPKPAVAKVATTAAEKVATETAETAATSVAEKATAEVAEKVVVQVAEKGATKAGKGWLAVGSILIVGSIGAYHGGKEYFEDLHAGRKPKRSLAAALAGGFGTELKTVGADAIALDDFKKGDLERGAGRFVQNFFFVPFGTYVDERRNSKAARHQDAGAVAQLIDIVPAKAKGPAVNTGHAIMDGITNLAGHYDSGNIYLDRIMQLKEMKARGVTTVGIARSGKSLLWSLDEHAGAIIYEGKKTSGDWLKETGKQLAFTLPDMLMGNNLFAGQDMDIDKAIEMNSRLYLGKGGKLADAQKAVAPFVNGDAQALQGIHQAAIDTTVGTSATSTNRAQAAAKPVASTLVARNVAVVDNNARTIGITKSGYNIMQPVAQV